MASAEDNTVSASLEGTEDEHRIYTAGAGYADDLYVSGIGCTVGTCKVSARIGTPVAAERNDGGSKFVIYLHIASTSAMICLLVKPFRSIAPEGQVTVQAPQPWQTAGLTLATRRTRVVRSGILNSFST